MKNKILSILLSLVCMFSLMALASCGNHQDSSEESSQSEQEIKPSWGLGEMPIQ